MRLFILLITFSFMACGKDDSKGNNSATIPTTGTAETASDGKDGKDGATGPQGPKGEKGDKGDKGDIGSVGATGASGKDAEPLPLNQWYDPLTGKYWLITTDRPWTATACGVWNWPTVAEMQQAIDHGIYLASADIGGPVDEAWTGVADSGGHVAILPGITGPDADTEEHGVFCVKD